MKKKIITISVIGLFLLTGLTALSVGGTETGVLEMSSTETGRLRVILAAGIFIPRGVPGATVTATAKDGSGSSYDIPYDDEHGDPCYYLEEIPVGDYEVTATKDDWTRTDSDVTINEGKTTTIVFIYSYIVSITNVLPSNPLISLLHQILTKLSLLR